jgi:hypothetical protein
MSRRELPATASRVTFLDNEAEMLGIILLFVLLHLLVRFIMRN